MPKEYIEYQNEITSADDLNKQGRKSDVLVAELEKCEKLEKQLNIAVEGLEEIITAYRMTPITRAELLLKQIKELDK